MQRHIIHKQRITLQVARREEAQGLQSMVSNLMQNELSAKMEAVFSELFPSDSIIRIDSLQLNLGNINPANFEQEFKTQFIEEFRRSLSSKKDNLSEANNEEELSVAQSLLSSLVYFLENGYLPWYRSAEKIAELEEEVLQNFTGNQYQYLFEWLRHYQDKRVVLRRLAMQFSDSFLEKLVLQLMPGTNTAWRALFNDFVTVISICLNQKRSFRVEIWKFTFHVLLNNSEQEVSSEDDLWAFQVLKLLLDRFALTGRSVTALMEIKVKKKLKTPVVRNAFKTLIAFLDTQEELHPSAEQVPLKNKPTKKSRLKEGESYINKEGLDTERYKNKKQVLPDGDAFYVKGGGAVILHFFLKPYFEDLKLLNEGKFIDTAAHQRAVLLLHYLATGQVEVAEFNLALHKILCGYPLHETLPASIILTKKEKTESEKLLIAVTDYWAPLKNTSVEGLRSAFLERGGKLTEKENGWLLTVEQKTIDVLLGKIPWGFSTIRLPWMEQILNVDWY